MELEFIRIGYRWWPQVMPWILLVTWGWITLTCVGFDGISWPGLLILGPIFLLNVIGIVRSFRRFEIDATIIATMGWFGRREMKWEEVQYVEVWQSRNTITKVIFYKEGDKQLIVNGPSDWWNIDYKQVLTFLEGQANQRGIRIYYSKSGMAIL